jgi:hypothetical protein
MDEWCEEIRRMKIDEQANGKGEGKGCGGVERR